jgi:hypothetical protein
MTKRRSWFVLALTAGTVAYMVLAAMAQGHISTTQQTGGTTTATVQSRILVDAPVTVSRANHARPHWEVQIAADPTDTRRLIACSIIGADNMNAALTYLSPRPMNIVIYSSADSGRTWQPSYELDKHPFNIDPTCAFGPDGTAYFMSFGGDVYSGLAWAREEFKSRGSNKELMRPPKRWSRMVMYRSSDAAKTWSEVGETDTSDRPYVTVDDTSGKYRGRVYVNGVASGGAGIGVAGIDGERIPGLAMLRSADRGQTYESTMLAVEGSRYVAANGNGIIMSDGTFATIFAEADPQAGDPQVGTTNEVHPASPNAKLKFVSSNDGGETFGKATVISDCYLRLKGTLIGMPSLAIDRTLGPFHGQLYAAWVDARSGRGEVRFARSNDKGKTWFPSLVISDNWPRDSNAEAPDAFLPTLAVNHNGVLGVMWYDRRDHTDNLGYDIRFSASLDGGESFLPSVLVSAGGGSASQMKEALLEGPFLASVSAGGRVHAAFNWSYFDGGGDTAGLTCDKDGVFHPLWIDRRAGLQQVSTTRITLSGTAMPNGGGGLESLRDLSDKVEVHYSPARLDLAKNEIIIGAAIYNRSNESIPGPVTLRLLGSSSNSGLVEVENADNGAVSSGAIWEFHTASGESLQPGALTAPRQLRFKLTHAPFPPATLRLSNQRDLVDLDTKILGK